MEIRKLKINEIKSWYDTELSEAFIPDERKPLEDFYLLIEEGKYDILVLEEKGQILAYGCFWKEEQIPFVLMDYLGVTKNLRNAGLGGKFLQELTHYYSVPILTESELPIDEDTEEENEIRRRRINFYIRHGFKPAYVMATCGLRWQALIFSDKPYELEEAMCGHKQLYGPKRDDVIVPLPEGVILPKPYWIRDEER